MNLGKAVSTQYYETSQETYGFSDIGHNSGNGWIPSIPVVVNIDHFLMLHRGHELRVLPDSAAKYAENIGFPHEWPDDNDDLDPRHNRSSFLDKEIPRPDSDQDLNNLSKELVERLRRF